MAEPKEVPGWRKRFLATRMTFESILFERELVIAQNENLTIGLLGLAGIWLFHTLLLAQWVMRRGYFFIGQDAANFAAVLRYADYLQSQGLWALVKPEFSSTLFNPPLYHLSFVPVLRYITTDLNLALIIVNSFFMLVLALSVFYAVRKSRPNRAGWLGAAYALALPFVLETARRPAPEIALMAMVAALYATYILSDEFDDEKWTFLFGLSLGLGFFCHRFFWLYVLPLVPFIVNGFSSSLSRDEMVKGVLPGLVLNLPWYIFAAIAVAMGFVTFRGAPNGFWAYLDMGTAAAGLPLFALGALALFWMYFSVFTPYEKKKVVAALFWVPYLVLTWLGGRRPELLYPVILVPFSIALPVMTPHQVRKYLLFFALALGAVSQSGLVPPLSIGSYRFGGLPLPPMKTYRADELIALVKANVPGAGGLVGIYGSDEGINSDSLRFAAVKAGCAAKFENNPVCPSCASVLIYRSGPPAAELPKEDGFAAVRAQPWFAQLFAQKSELVLADASKIEVYAKAGGPGKIFEEGIYKLSALAFGPLKIEEATLRIDGYDAAAGSYAKAALFAPTASLLGGDVYGLVFEMRGLELGGQERAPVLAGMKKLKLRSASINSYALEMYLAEKLPALADLQVSLDRTVAISALARGYKLNAEFMLVLPQPGVLEVQPVAFSFAFLDIPQFFLNLFSFRVNFSDNPYNLEITGLRIRGQMLEFY